jgi:[ribosomal protein S5]-alanine N-acetyltransferase
MCAALSLPTLAAGRYQLRAFMMTDLELVKAGSADPLIPLITTVPAPFTQDKGRRFIERQWSRAEQGTGYSFVIAEAATGLGVGQIGLWLQNIHYGRASVGYWVAGPARGRQVAGSAIAALTRWAHGELAIPRLELYVEPWNTGSIRTAERAGFQREGLLRSWQQVGSERKDMYIYGRLVTDALPLAP